MSVRSAREYVDRSRVESLRVVIEVHAGTIELTGLCRD